MAKRRIYVGTPGWTYDDWQGAFYPDDVKGAEQLSRRVAAFDDDGGSHGPNGR